MNIAIIGTAYPYRGGLTAFNERLAHEYQSQGHNVDIYTFTHQYPDFLFPGKTQYDSKPAPNDLKITRCVHSYNPFNWFKIGRKIAKKNYDVAIFAYWTSFMAPCMGTIARKIRSNNHTKVVALVHNIIPHEQSIIDKICAPYLVKSVDYFIALSESVVRDINKFDKDKKPKCFSPHPIYDNFGEKLPQNEAQSILNLDQNHNYALFFGFIRSYKGLDLIISAFAESKLKDSDIKLIVAGEFYDNPEPYLQQIKNLHLEDKIILHNEFIPDNEVNRFFCAADIVVQPYKTATQSGVTQIAFHFEKPMIVTNVGGLPEIVPDGKIGFVVEPDAKQISVAICRFFDENKQEEFENNIIEEKKKYAWSTFVGKINEMIKS